MGKPSPAPADPSASVGFALLRRKNKSYSSPAQGSCNHRITESFQLEKIFKAIKMILFLLKRKFHSGELDKNEKF